MSKPAGRDLPAYIRAEFIQKMALAIRRKQLTVEQAMQEVARECFAAQRPEAVPTAEALAAARYIMDNARDYGERETILANEIVRLGMNKEME